MRVYEVAKLLNLSNKELLDLLAKHKFSIKSHMSAVTPEMLKFLDEWQQKKETQTVIQKEPQKTVEKKVEPEAPAEKKEMPKEVLTKEKRVSFETKKTHPLVLQPMTLGEFAEKINKSSSDVILALLKQGIAATKNQVLAQEILEKLCKAYDIPIAHPEKTNQEVALALVRGDEGTKERLPVVVVLGHVDHGKTTLLDFIRKTKVVAKEKGGITQHLGAYEAATPHGNIVFIDTPGHEAFSNIRGRGVKVADLAVLVIAADDSIMPQTVEAIKKIQAVQIPVVVAINKIDKVDPSRLEVVKNDLARYNLLPEEWGGDVVSVPISAKTGNGVDKLLEMIALQAELMDLKTDEDRPATGFVLESKIEKGLGPVATVICQHGTLHQGDYFVAGNAVGRVSALIDSYGKRLSFVGASVPVRVVGFSELPHAGDSFEVISKEKYKKLKNTKLSYVPGAKHVASEQAINVILKADTSSSLEALKESLEKLFGRKKERLLNIVYDGVGQITESDVALAANTNSQIIGFSVKAQPNATVAATKNIVRILTFDIIYKLLEYFEDYIESLKQPVYVSKVIGKAVIRKVFAIKNIGVVAGAYVTEGRFARDGFVVAKRGKEIIGEGPIKSLERDRKPVKEVHSGFEFAFLVDEISDWQIDDVAECYIKVPE